MLGVPKSNSPSPAQPRAQGDAQRNNSYQPGGSTEFSYPMLNNVERVMERYMKKLAALLCLSAIATGAFAQGLVNFANNPNTLVSATINGNTAAISGAAGSYYFGLLTSASGAAGSFTFTGLYGTNLVNSTGGRFSGGNGIAVANWAAGTTMSFFVAGWEASLGATFNPSWLTAPDGLIGLSPVGSGVAGGGAQSLPTLQLFGGTGITAGWTLDSPTLVPEPSSMALAGLSAAALLIFRRRK